MSFEDCLLHWLRTVRKPVVFHFWSMEKEARTGKVEYEEPPSAPLLDTNEFYLWSFYRAIIAEFVATLLFLYVTIATVIGNANDKSPCGGVGTLGIAWSFGGMIFVLVYCTAGISGGNLIIVISDFFLPWIRRYLIWENHTMNHMMLLQVGI